jgi:hypothetical protein
MPRRKVGSIAEKQIYRERTYHYGCTLSYHHTSLRPDPYWPGAHDEVKSETG